MPNTYCSIEKARAGFSYQDKYALLVFLTRAKEKQLGQFYVDFPFSDTSGRSIDIRIVNTDGSEELYEVKTGDQFKGKIKEFFIALRNLSDYETICGTGSCLKAVVVSPENLSLIHNIQARITYLRSVKNYTAGHARNFPAGVTSRQLADELVEAFNKVTPITRLSVDELSQFLQNVREPEIGREAQRSNPTELSDMEREITSLIDYFSGKAGITNAHPYLESRAIMLELLDIIERGAGSGEDLQQEIYQKLVDCLGLRKAIEGIQSGSASDRIKRGVEVVEPLIASAMGLTTEPTIEATVISEGGEIS